MNGTTIRKETLISLRITMLHAHALELWSQTGVERGGEGHPGLPGPSGDPNEVWDSDEATLTSVITTLQTIQTRYYKKRSGTDPAGVPVCESCQRSHNVETLGPIGPSSDSPPDWTPPRCTCCGKTAAYIATLRTI
jgi:hypothetical protein